MYKAEKSSEISELQSTIDTLQLDSEALKLGKTQSEFDCQKQIENLAEQIL